MIISKENALTILPYSLIYCNVYSYYRNNFTEKLIYSFIFLALISLMEQSPSSEANSRSSIPEIPRLSLNPKAHCYLHKSLPLFLIPSQMNPVHIIPSYFFQICFNIILTSPLSSKPSGSTINVCVPHLYHACYIILYLHSQINCLVKF
jgi:hypothetical protein